VVHGDKLHGAGRLVPILGVAAPVALSALGQVVPFDGRAFDAINFACIAIYKLGILLFNLVPYVALWIVG
jgi:hypothetical protein